MKKIIVSALAVAFSTASFAQDVQNVPSTYAEKFSQALKVSSQKSTTANQSSNTVVSQPNISESQEKINNVNSSEPSKEATKSESLSNDATESSQTQEVKPKPKKVIVKKQKPKEISIENSKVLSASTLELPSNIPLEEVGKFLNNISSEQTTIKVVESSGKKLSFYIEDSRTGEKIAPSFLSSDAIQGLAVDSDLKNIVSTKTEYTGGLSTIDLNGIGDCQAVYLTYSLKGISEPITKNVFLDRFSNQAEGESSTCKFANLDANETTFYTKSGYILNAGFDKKKAANGQIGISIHMSKDGRPFSSSDTIVYAIAKDFKKAYPLEVKHDSRGTFFGSKVEKPVAKGTYYIVIGFSYEGKREWVSTITSIN